MKWICFVLFCVYACACAAPDALPDSGPIVIHAVDTLVSTESGTIAYAVDLDVSPDGYLFVADYRANQLLRFRIADVDTTRIGRQGEGPSEFDGPWAIRATDEALFVVDRGNGRIQRLTRSGDYVSSAPLSGMVTRAFPFVMADGGLVIGSSGRDSCLAVLFGPSGGLARRVGVPVVVPPTVADFRAIKAAIRDGKIPDDLRNEALVAADSIGTVWVALQTEAEIRTYDPQGRLTSTVHVDEPEMMGIRAEFFERNAADENPATFTSLRYFRDLTLVGEDLWVLLATAPDSAGIILVVPARGGPVRRIEIAGAGGARSLAVDPEGKTVFLFTSDDAQLLAARLPSE